MKAPLTISVETLGGDAASASLASLRCVLEPRGLLGDATQALVEFLSGSINGTDNRCDLFRLESLANAAGGAIELVSIKILPCERFLELVSAVAVEREDVSLGFLHGWPILSLAGDTASMAELPGSGNCARQGGRA